MGRCRQRILFIAIIMYMLNNIAGIDLTYVPYDDGGMCRAALLLGGHIGLSTVSLAEAEEHMAAGNMVALAACAMSGLTRSPRSPPRQSRLDIGHQQSWGHQMNAGGARRGALPIFRPVPESPETEDWIEYAESNAMTVSFYALSGVRMPLRC